MVTLSTADETILQSDRVPVYLGVNSLYLKKGLQSSKRSIEIPNEIIKEQGNEVNRGMSIQAPKITTGFDDLAVDLDMEQILAESWSTLGTVTGLKTNLKNNLVSHMVGPTDKIQGLVISFVSGAGKYTRIGEGGLASSVTATVLKVASAGVATNFVVGDHVIIQQNSSVTNISANSSVITRISGLFLTFTGAGLSGASANGTTARPLYVYKADTNPVLTQRFASGGVPLKSVKGIEVFANKNLINTGSATSKTFYAAYPITAIGVSTDIDSNDFRDSNIDIVMLYNDYNDNLIYTRYLQDAAVTSVAYNYTADGNAMQNYEFTTGKSMDYAGYVNRRSIVASGASATISLALKSGVFRGSEVIDPIAANTTLNEAGDRSKNFLKVQTLTAGTRKVWKEVASGTSSLNTDEYKYVSGTKVITFGATVASGARIEFTYLCDAAYVASDDAYKFDSTAFDKTGTPVAVTGRYQPLTINSSDANSFTNRIDGLESSTFTVTFARDYFNSQGIISQRVKPSQIGAITGSFNSKEGFSKIMNVINTGTYTTLSNKQQMDASKSSIYTNSNTIPLRVRLYEPSNNIDEIKTVEIDAIQITNIENTNAVGSDSGMNISFSGVRGNLKFSR
jgi:hypothetical protein